MLKSNQTVRQLFFKEVSIKKVVRFVGALLQLFLSGRPLHVEREVQVRIAQNITGKMCRERMICGVKLGRP